MDRFKKIFTISIMMVTVLAMSVVVAPSVDAAASAGDLIKMDGMSSLYYLGADGNRYVFPNEATYFSWYNDFSTVVTVSQEEIETYPLKANVTIRPGTKLVTSPSNSKVYAVTPEGVLRYIASEEAAISLWGADWATMVVDVVDSFFTNYSVGTALPVGEYPAGQLYKMIDGSDVYYMDADGTARKVADEAAFLANRFDWDYLATAPETFTVPTAGTEITGMEDGLKDTSQGGGGTGEVAETTGSGLTVALASDTPAASTIPQNSSVQFVKVNLTAANDGDVNVTSIKLTAGGFGTATNIDNVAIYKSGMRVGNIKNIDSNNEAVFNFSSPIAVEAGSTETVTVKAAVTAGTDQHFLGIKSASDISTNGATISGSFPVNGNVMSVANVTVGELTIASDGTPSNPDLGDEDAILAKFKLTNDNVEDITFNSIVFKRSAGTAADDDFENMTLVSGGEVVATSAGLSNKYVTFELDSPMLIEKGKIKKFQVKADIIDGASKTVLISLNNAVDVDAVGEYYGQSSLITGSFTGTTLTIQAGAISLAKENATLTSVRSDETDVEFGTIKVTANSANQVEMTTLILTADAVNDTKSAFNFNFLSNVEIWDKGANTVYELTAVTGGDSDTALFSNTDLGLYLSSGQTKELVIRADVSANASSSSVFPKYTFKVNDASGGDMVLRETENETNISDITPNSITLKQITVKNPAVTLTLNAIASETVVVGAEDVETISVNIEANTVDDIKITELKFMDRSDSTMTNSVISSLNLYKGDILVDAKSGSDLSSPGEEITFNDLSETVSAGKSNTYSLKATFVNDSSNNGATTTWYLSGYSAEDVKEGTSRYDATADNVTVNGVIASGETGYTSLLSGKVVTLSGAGTLRVQMDNTNSEANQDTYVVAGTESDILGAIKMRAENEAIYVSELTVFGDYTTFKEMVSKVYLVDSDKTTVLAEETVTGATTTFDSFVTELEVGESSKTIYIKADFINIGKAFVGDINATSTLTVTDIVAEGRSSGTTLADSVEAATVCASGKICWDATGNGTYDNADHNTAASKEFGSVATRISNVELVDSAEGTSLDTNLTTGWNKAAIIKITTDSANNTLANGEEAKTMLEQFKVQVTKNGGTALAQADAVRIKRLGSGFSDQVASTSVTAASSTVYATIDVTDSELVSDDQIANGTTAYFLVEVNVASLEASISDWVQVNLDKFNGSNYNASATGATLKWKDGSDANAKDDLRLNTTSVDGTKIVEAT